MNLLSNPCTHSKQDEAFTGVRLTVEGEPATQGSKKAFVNKKTRKVSLVEMDAKLPAWRAAIIKAAQTETGPDWKPLDGALVCHLDVFLPAPGKSKFGLYPAGVPDLDKLERAVGDGLSQAGTIVDDARIVRWHAEKHWGVGFTGAIIHVHQIEEQAA